MPKTCESLEKALFETRKLIESPADVLEYTPKEEGSSGPVPNHATWETVRRDLADLPRGVRVVIRKKGSRSKAYVPVCLPREEATEIARYSPEQLEMKRAIEADRWEALHEYAKVLKFKNDSLDEIFSLKSDVMGIVRQGIENANSAGANANLISQLIAEGADLQDKLSEAKDKAEIIRAVKLYVDKTLDMVKASIVMKKVKSLPELDKAFPAFGQEYKDFLRWKREKEYEASSPREDEEGQDDPPPSQPRPRSRRQS